VKNCFFEFDKGDNPSLGGSSFCGGILPVNEMNGFHSGNMRVLYVNIDRFYLDIDKD
jgi:hypothetical protein